VLELQGQQVEALAVYGQAIDASDEPVFHLERGQLLVRMQRYQDALPDLDRAVAGAPTNGAAYLWRGWARQAIWAETGRANREIVNGALADFQRAVVLDPADSIALDRFARLYARIRPSP
jgi:tetratricopeptide (TPR) repeat protein